MSSPLAKKGEVNNDNLNTLGTSFFLSCIKAVLQVTESLQTVFYLSHGFICLDAAKIRRKNETTKCLGDFFE